MKSTLSKNQLAEEIIRSNSLTADQVGYDRLTDELDNKYYISPSEYIAIRDCIDWLSQDGYEGN